MLSFLVVVFSSFLSPFYIIHKSKDDKKRASEREREQQPDAHTHTEANMVLFTTSTFKERGKEGTCLRNVSIEYPSWPTWFSLFVALLKSIDK